MEKESRGILTVDIGNTAVKVGLYRDGVLEQSIVTSAEGGVEAVEALLLWNTVDGAAVCSVNDRGAAIVESLGMAEIPVMELTPKTPLPIEVAYDRSTLGADRVAAAVGVAEEGRAVLVVDAGTAMTVDLVAEGKFLGGNISPGLRLRFRSLHEFTSRLPQVDMEGELPMFGHDTATAIRAGVVRGLASEVAMDVAEARKRYEEVKLVLTGGDADRMAPLLGQYGLEAEVMTEAVGRGLLKIFNYNNL